MKLPDGIGTLIGIALQLATNVGDEMHSRAQSNTYLDQVNESFFAPRGLVAMVMTWKPNQSEMITTANFDTQSPASSAETRKNNVGLSKFKHKFDQSNAVSSFEWPQTAPLIFPGVDDSVVEALQVKKPNAMKRSNEFCVEYRDRRARAKWAGRNLQSNIANATPKETFASRFSDPNHPASSGDPLALITGGHFQIPSVPLGNWRTSNKGQKSETKEQESSSNDEIRKFGKAALPWVTIGLSLLKKDVLYLMIVKRPTEQQMTEASRLLNSHAFDEKSSQP